MKAKCILWAMGFVFIFSLVPLLATLWILITLNDIRRDIREIRDELLQKK